MALIAAHRGPSLRSQFATSKRCIHPVLAALQPMLLILSVYCGHGGEMIGLLESKRQAIAGLCGRFGVARLEVFGSSIRDDFKPGQSDLDLLVEFQPMESYARVDAYFGLLDELRSLLNQDIDLVMTGAVKNRYLSLEIE